MRSFNLEAQQIITNKANNKQDFTFCLKNKNKRFIVGTKNIYKGINPSLKFNLISDISNVLKNCNFDSIGGWQDKNTGIYYLDANKHYNDKIEALKVAEKIGELAIFDTLKNKVINL